MEQGSASSLVDPLWLFTIGFFFALRRDGIFGSLGQSRSENLYASRLLPYQSKLPLSYHIPIGILGIVPVMSAEKSLVISVRSEVGF